MTRVRLSFRQIRREARGSKETNKELPGERAISVFLPLSGFSLLFYEGAAAEERVRDTRSLQSCTHKKNLDRCVPLLLCYSAPLLLCSSVPTVMTSVRSSYTSHEPFNQMATWLRGYGALNALMYTSSYFCSFYGWKLDAA